MKKAIISFATLFLAIFILAGCSQKTSSKQNITIVGSTALQPMV